MKSISFLKIASVILATLFLIAAFPWLSSIISPKNEASTSENFAPSINLSSFTEESVASVSIAKKDTDDIVLKKEDGSWKIGSEDADTDKITSLFQSFSTLAPHEMVSKNEDNFDKFGVTKDNGIRLEIRSTSGTASVFYIGNDSDIPQEFYIRKDGIKNTYSAKGTLRNLLTQDAAYWKKAPEGKSENEASGGDNTSSSKEVGK